MYTSICVLAYSDGEQLDKIKNLCETKVSLINKRLQMHKSGMAFHKWSLITDEDILLLLLLLLL